MTALVTGGSGYFGSLLVAELLARGERVRVFDLNDAADRPADVEFVRGDIRDPDAVAVAVRGSTRIFHNVAQVPLARNAALLRSVNVDGTVNLLAAAHDAGVHKVVHTSSSAVFGIPDHNPVLPTTVPRPQEPYGDAKLAAEWACLAASSRGLDVSILRPRTIIGHGRLGIFGILFDWIADGADPIVLGDGTNRYQFVHARDLATAAIAAAGRPGSQIYNIGAPDVPTMAETIQSVCDHAGTGTSVRRVPARAAALAMRATASVGIAPFAPYHWLMYANSMWFDIDPAMDELSWSPRFTTSEMFAESYDWFIEHERSHELGERSLQEPLSHHRKSSRQGVLSLAKRLSGILPPVQ